MVDTTVKYFDSTMSGAPALSGEAGKLIAILDACLSNGFGSVNLDSLVIASNVATGTVSAGHNFAMVGSTGPVITIAGSTVTGDDSDALNQQWRIASIPSSTTFTFATTGISDQTATGSITAKRSPLGWQKTHSGTNKAAYSRTAVGATAMLLRIDDSPAQYPTLLMYETMSDVDTGTNPSPTSSTFYTGKSSGASADARPWMIVGDDYLVYVLLDSSNSGTRYNSGFTFGDLKPYLSASGYHCMLIAHNSASNNYHYLYQLTTASLTAALLARGESQLGRATALSRQSCNTSSTGLGYDGATFPNPVTNAVILWMVEAWAGGFAVGVMPGLWNPIHPAAQLPTTYNFSALIDGTTRTVTFRHLHTGGYCAVFDLTGPWR